jgi:hypothetical protein
VPEGYGLGIWRRMVYSGCKAIGEREYLKLSMECGRRVFPHDFPNTEAGQKQLLEQAVSFLENDYCLKPASKRVNYQAIRQPCPFFPISSFEFKAPVFVEILAMRRVPRQNALLYFPTEDDIKTIT